MAGPPNDHYAIVGKRLGFRLAYLGTVHDDRVSWVTIRLDDQFVKVRHNSVSVRDIINDTPNTATLTIDNDTPPTVGQRLTLRVNSNAPRLLFAGPLQTIGLTFEGKPVQTVYPCQAIDDTPLANRKLPYGQWVTTSATTVAQWLVTTFCPAGFSAAAVQATLPAVSVNFDATEGMDGCLRQLAKLIGGYFYWEDRVLHLFTDGEPGDTPDPIDATHPFLHDPPISISTDTSQVRTRVYGKGYAEEVIADVAAGDPIVPISNAVMFNVNGGQAVTETQRLKYTGTMPGGGGTLIGPGVQPATAPTVTLGVGAGVTAGSHDYAVSFVTAAGESLVGPRASIAVGLLPPPVPLMNTAPALGGDGPSTAGDLYYATTFVTASGETTNGGGSLYTQKTIAAGTTPITTPIAQWDGIGYSNTNPPMHAGDHIALYYSYSADPTTADNYPFTNNETPISPASGGYVLEQAPGKPAGTFQNFAFQVPYSHDPNVKTVHVWMSINFQAMFLLRVVSGAQGLGWPNQPAQTWAFVNYAQYFLPQPTYTAPATFNPILGGVALTLIPLGPAGVTARRIYRTAAGGLKLLTTINDNTTTNLVDHSPDAWLTTPPPATGTAPAAQVAVSAIPLGSATVTGRKLYRTAANDPALKLLATLADNTTTTYTDALADASLGAAAPAGDTSGLKQQEGAVLAGAIAMVVAGVGWASPSGGWAVIGNGQQTIRYTGYSPGTSTLRGIPSTGPGAIVATVAYGATITAAPALLGVTGLLRALIKGAPINLWVQRDDLAAQSAIAATDHTDGVIEHLITDERRGETSLTQLCDADLAQYSTPIQTVPYATRDVKTKSGKPITFALASPSIYATLTIQDVTITEINLARRLNPKFTVTASSVRFSLEDILRRLGANLDVTS